MYSVYGIGNPLMDYLIYAGPELVEMLEAKPGTMNLISLDERNRILSAAENVRFVPGGSCANTVRGVAWLGKKEKVSSPIYSGAVGRGAVGSRYISEMQKLGVTPRIVRKSAETGVSCVVVTPDHERTMFTYLGACRDYSSGDLDTEALRRCRFLHVTGYMWDTENQKQATQRAAQIARSSGAAVSFDLADPLVVGRYGKEFIQWIPEHVDVLFGNRQEFSLMLGTEGSHRDITRMAGQLAPVVAVKVGAQGCFLNDGKSIEHFPAVDTRVIDTVGAGDGFAAGFLFGLLGGRDISECACLANKLASAIVSVEGCGLDRLNQADIL